MVDIPLRKARGVDIRRGPFGERRPAQRMVKVTQHGLCGLGSHALNPRSGSPTSLAPRVVGFAHYSHESSGLRPLLSREQWASPTALHLERATRRPGPHSGSFEARHAVRALTPRVQHRPIGTVPQARGSSSKLRARHRRPNPRGKSPAPCMDRSRGRGAGQRALR